MDTPACDRNATKPATASKSTRAGRIRRAPPAGAAERRAHRAAILSATLRGSELSWKSRIAATPLIRSR